MVLQQATDRRPRQHLHVVEKGGEVTVVPEVPLKSLKGMSKTDLRETYSFSGSPHRFPERGRATSDALDRHPAAGARALKP